MGWHGYAPYNVAMLEKYVTIFGAVNNFVFVGNGATPAMRLGFTNSRWGSRTSCGRARACRSRSGRGGGGNGSP